MYLAQSGIELKHLRLSNFSAISYLILIHYSFFICSFCKTVAHSVQAKCHCSYYLCRCLARKGIVMLGVMPSCCVCPLSHIYHVSTACHTSLGGEGIQCSLVSSFHVLARNKFSRKCKTNWL